MADEESKIKWALEIAQETSGEACLSDAMLGVYLDGGTCVDDGGKTLSRAALEEHLAGCLSCQERMVGLYRDVKAVLDPEESIELVSEHFAGESASFQAHKDEERDTLIPEASQEDTCDGLGDLEERKG